MAVALIRYSALPMSCPAARPMRHFALAEGRPRIIDVGFAAVRSGKMTTLARQRHSLHVTAGGRLDLPTGTIAALIHISPS